MIIAVQLRYEPTEPKFANIRESAYYKNFKFSLSTNIQAKIDNIPGEINEIEVSSLDMNISINGAISSKDSKDEPFRSLVKKYDFKLIDEFREKGLFLHPPHGDNFYLIARSHAELREEIHQFLKPNGLEFLLDEETKRVAIVHKENTSLISFPLHLVPDTFQRYIFHLAAIMSNRDSVLLFEEPESHSYAPYVYQLAQHILNDEGGNQYFITTHSPYFLLPLMQEGKDVAVFATWFEDYQTHARRLTEEEIREMLDFGVDVFLNLDHFTPA
ncbi:MAG: ATP-binding protein [Lewinellaceae bacterium]|nr:ATP-binding protein [Lewinellaceae bacterium]